VRGAHAYRYARFQRPTALHVQSHPVRHTCPHARADTLSASAHKLTCNDRCTAADAKKSLRNTSICRHRGAERQAVHARVRTSIGDIISTRRVGLTPDGAHDCAARRRACMPAEQAPYRGDTPHGLRGTWCFEKNSSKEKRFMYEYVSSPHFTYSSCRPCASVRACVRACPPPPPHHRALPVSRVSAR
jgi:hypothetical protein